MTQEKTVELQDLGYANSWPSNENGIIVPDIVIKCRDAKHHRDIHTVANCVTQYTCKECGYTYKVDSGD